jgi:hypothetical protein
MSKVASIDPVLAEGENSTSTLPRYWSRLWPQNCLAWLFVLFALPIVIFFDVTVPPGEVPDEPFHILRAASILNGEIIGHRATFPSNGRSVAVAGVYVDSQLLFAASGLWPMTGETKMTRTISDRLGGVKWTGNHDFIGAPNTAIYFPAFYVPAALGLGIARLVGVQPFHAIIVGRLVAPDATADVRSRNLSTVCSSSRRRLPAGGLTGSSLVRDRGSQCHNAFPPC